MIDLLKKSAGCVFKGPRPIPAVGLQSRPFRKRLSREGNARGVPEGSEAWEAGRCDNKIPHNPLFWPDYGPSSVGGDYAGGSCLSVDCEEFPGGRIWGGRGYPSGEKKQYRRNLSRINFFM